MCGSNARLADDSQPQAGSDSRIPDGLVVTRSSQIEMDRKLSLSQQQQQECHRHRHKHH